MILVTGATGHIGNVLVRELLERGWPLRVFLLPGEDESPLAGLKLQRVYGDVLDLAALRRAMEGVEIVFHLAGLISILPGKDERLYQVNVVGTQNVVQVAQEQGVRRLVYTSSIHAIPPGAQGSIIDESIPIDPRGLRGEYDRSKALATLHVLAAANEGFPAVVVCPTGVIGPHDYRRSEMGKLILDSMRRKMHFIIDGAYDFVDVRDVARGLVLAAELGHPGEHYILSGERITISGLIAGVSQFTGLRGIQIMIPMGLARLAASLTGPLSALTRIKPRLTPYALNTVTANSIISHEKATRELGYEPRPLMTSIADSVSWFRENLHRRPGLQAVRRRL